MADMLRPDHLATWLRVQEDLRMAQDRMRYVGQMLLSQYGVTDGTLLADGTIVRALVKRPDETSP